MIGNHVYGQPYRGFESPPLRHFSSLRRKNPGDAARRGGQPGYGHPIFRVSRFQNRNGVCSERVAEPFNGVRVCRNFTTEEEAAAEKAARNSRRIGDARAVAWLLAEDVLAHYRELAALAEAVADPCRHDAA